MTSRMFECPSCKFKRSQKTYEDRRQLVDSSSTDWCPECHRDATWAAPIPFSPESPSEAT